MDTMGLWRCIQLNNSWGMLITLLAFYLSLWSPPIAWDQYNLCTWSSQDTSLNPICPLIINPYYPCYHGNHFCNTILITPLLLLWCWSSLPAIFSLTPAISQSPTTFIANIGPHNFAPQLIFLIHLSLITGLPLSISIQHHKPFSSLFSSV